MNVKIKVPTSLSDIKLSQYQKFIRQTKDKEDSIYIVRQLVSIFCNLNDNLVLKMTKKDFNNIVDVLTSILNEKPEVKHIIKHNGKEYGLIPDVSQMTVGEQADLDSMWNDYDKRGKVMAVLYRPIIVKARGNYLIEDYTGKEEELDLPMDIVKGAEVFFYNILNDCVNFIQKCTEGEEFQTNLLQVLGKNGDGINQSMDLLKETFSNLKKQLSYY
jgi:hypothetical protein